MSSRVASGQLGATAIVGQMCGCESGRCPPSNHFSPFNLTAFRNSLRHFDDRIGMSVCPSVAPQNVASLRESLVFLRGPCFSRKGRRRVGLSVRLGRRCWVHCMAGWCAFVRVRSQSCLKLFATLQKMDERWLCLLLLLLVVLLPSFPSASSTKTRGSQTRRSTFPFTGRGAESQFILFGGAARTRRRPAHPRQGFAQKDANQDGPARERHRERERERERGGEGGKGVAKKSQEKRALGKGSRLSRGRSRSRRVTF